jgi:hypothetical protein
VSVVEVAPLTVTVPLALAPEVVCFPGLGTTSSSRQGRSFPITYGSATTRAASHGPEPDAGSRRQAVTFFGELEKSD